MSDRADMPVPVAELLAGRALGDLTDAESSKVQSASKSNLYAKAELAKEAAELDRTAGILMRAFAEDDLEGMPADLRKQICDEAASVIEAASGDDLNTPSVRDRLQSVIEAREEDAVRLASAGIEPGGTPSADRVTRREWIAWASVAAIALIAVGFNFLKPVQTFVSTDTPQKLRLRLLSSADDVIVTQWGPGKTKLPGTASGDVVWSTSSQQGVMRFVGLPINDPSIDQYQLWIIDPSRDDEPVDGGVFDIATGGESLVAIDAKLNVIDPVAFAITIEQPGGVVVSTQERLPLLASVN